MLKQLHALIGQRITHNNKLCVLIEIIDDGPYLVFQCLQDKTIQCNQYGNAHRKSAPTYTIHCLNDLKDDLHPVLKDLIPEIEREKLVSELTR